MKIAEATIGGSPEIYLRLEHDSGDLRTHLQKKIGHTVTNAMYEFIFHNEKIKKSRNWKPEWNRLNATDCNWAMFMGGKTTQTPMHYDDSDYQFLYVREGMKEVILIPNDDRIAGKVKTHLTYDGGEGYLELDAFDKSNTVAAEHAVRFIVKAGQGIVIPYVAYHAVRNPEASLAFTFRIT